MSRGGAFGSWVVAAVLACMLAGCGTSSSDASDSSSSPPPSANPRSTDTFADLAARDQKNEPIPTAVPTAPPTPNPDEASGMVSRFYRLLSSKDKTASSELGTILSADFLRNVGDDWTRNYGYISNARVSIDGVRGRKVDYTVDYDYVGQGAYRLRWERSGTWAFSHGSGHWFLDSDTWKSVQITTLVTTDGSINPVTSDVAHSDGSHRFMTPFGPLDFSATKTGWRVASVPETPPPVAAPQQPTLVDQPAPAAHGHFVPDSDLPVTRPPAHQSSDCEEVSVEGVYQDGEVLKLDDGRFLKVDSSDTPTSSVWVTPFDGLICDDKFTNKDDNETVDLAE